MAALQKWVAYFKPTRRVHSSGFRCFECGYCQIDENKLTVTKKIILGISVDHIFNAPLFGAKKEKACSIDIDLTKDGYIRVFSHDESFFWSIPGWSDAEITSDKLEMVTDEQLDDIWKQQNKVKGEI